MTDDPKLPIIAPAFDTGIHYVKERTAPPAPRRETCWKCGSTATCMPRLYVPCSRIAPKRIKDISALMPMTLCDRHFSLLRADEFTCREFVRNAIGELFKQRGSYPDFSRAVIGRIPIADPDFARGQKAVELARKT